MTVSPFIYVSVPLLIIKYCCVVVVDASVFQRPQYPVWTACSPILNSPIPKVPVSVPPSSGKNLPSMSTVQVRPSFLVPVITPLEVLNVAPVV